MLCSNKMASHFRPFENPSRFPAASSPAVALPSSPPYPLKSTELIPSPNAKGPVYYGAPCPLWAHARGRSARVKAEIRPECSQFPCSLRSGPVASRMTFATVEALAAWLRGPGVQNDRHVDRPLIGRAITTENGFEMRVPTILHTPALRCGSLWRWKRQRDPSHRHTDVLRTASRNAPRSTRRPQFGGGHDNSSGKGSPPDSRPQTPSSRSATGRQSHFAPTASIPTCATAKQGSSGCCEPPKKNAHCLHVQQRPADSGEAGRDSLPGWYRRPPADLPGTPIEVNSDSFACILSM